MVDCNQIDFRSDKYLIANRYAAATEESAALLDEAPFSDGDRLTVVDVEWRQHRCTFFKRFTENLAHISVYLFGGAVTRIHFCGNLDGSENVLN